MPHYEYRCKNCQNTFEKFQKISEAPIKNCPSCLQETAVRIPSAGAALSFQGKGFYITDYGSKKTSSCACGKEDACSA
jgi:putative FmdB family regulatory protein